MQSPGDGSGLVSTRHGGKASVFEPDPLWARLGRDEDGEPGGSRDAENFIDCSKWLMILTAAGSHQKLEVFQLLSDFSRYTICEVTLVAERRTDGVGWGAVRGKG